LNRRVRLERDTLWLSVTDVIVLLVGIVVHVILTQTFTDGNYGRWVLLLDLYYVLSTIIDLGLPTLIGRDSERLGKAAHGLVHRTLQLQLQFALPVILVGGVAGWLWVGGSTGWLIAAYILVFSACTQILTYAHRAALRALGESRKEALVRLVDRGITGAGIVLAVSISGAAPISLALATLAGPLAAIVLAINLGEKRLLIVESGPSDLKTADAQNRELIQLGLPFLFASIALVVNIRIEKLLLGIYSDPMDVEIFQIAWLAFIAGYAIIISLRAVLLSWFGEVRNNVEKLNHRRVRTRLLLIPATLIGIIVGYTLGRAAIGWAFPEYAKDAQPIFSLLLITWGFAMISSEPLTTIQISERPSVYAGILWIGICIDVIACILLIPSAGVQGAAIGAAFGGVAVLGLAIGSNSNLQSF